MVEIKIARTREEIEGVYRLRYRVFAEEMGFVDPKQYPDKLLYDEFDEMPGKTTIFMAVNGGEIVGTIRIIRDGPGGLPMDGYTDFRELRSRYRIAECSRLLTAPEYRKRNADMILMGLVKIGTIWSVEQGIDYIVITAKQEVADSFFRKLGFAPIAEPVDLPEFNDPSALPMGIKLTGIIDPARSFILKESRNIEKPYHVIRHDFFTEK